MDRKSVSVSAYITGEIILYVNFELWYSFRSGHLFRYLTADEFHRFHNSVLAFDWKRLPTKLVQSPYVANQQSALNVTLFGALTRADLLELRELIGKAALPVTTLSRVYNHLN
ncbi:hypothetical protein IC229_24980 [Spirosoma sp. BT702]|uniref:Uncharacterized protein n=1 Tax=Spirosoma profusum TaxID=2771354 RepID=A0A926Y402_9BACT|nr:hypothetical protein [Spirosoma profusum]MBD2703923.1 hypothetical protein [Spirosoma profusum]